MEKNELQKDPRLYIGVDGTYIPITRVEGLCAAGNTLLLWVNCTFRDECREEMEKSIGEQIHMPVLILNSYFDHAILLENTGT